MKLPYKCNRGLRISSVLLAAGFFFAGCDRQDGRITEITEEVAQLRQEVRHLRSLKTLVEKLDQEYSQKTNDAATNPNANDQLAPPPQSNEEFAINSSPSVKSPNNSAANSPALFIFFKIT